jgi:2-dehydro-3-deoxyphosphooctonate aldolase (KDO 8-P synthase)
MSAQVVIGADLPHVAQAGGEAPLLVIAGPCMIEDAGMVMATAERLQGICAELGLGFVFKSSYLKDNRTSVDSDVGPGLQEGLEVLQRVRSSLGVPVLSDIHERAEIEAASEVLDVLQIPAFLCRQTRLLVEASASGCCINVKKGQFLSPMDVQHIVRKYESVGTGGLLITERGASFGYGNLVVDMRGFQIMRQYRWPVVFDITHSLQMPSSGGAETAGDRRFASLMARAACAAGVEAVFLEAHPDPQRARSDRATQIPLDEVPALLRSARAFHELAREYVEEIQV